MAREAHAEAARRNQEGATPSLQFICFFWVVGERAELIPFASWAKAVLCFLEK